jgi:hypothetical protein
MFRPFCAESGGMLSSSGLSPQCPQEGSVTGRIAAANVIAGSHPSQQLNTGAAMRTGAAYMNVHTNPSPGGEIRGQIRVVGK